MTTSVPRLWKQYVPARVSEILAFISVMTTFVLFIHTNHLQSKLQTYNDQLAATAELGSSGGYNTIFYSSGAKDNSQISKNKYAYKYYDLREYAKMDPSSLNNTKNHPKLTMMFNRVPKVGSQSIMELLRALSYKNGFTFHKDRPQKTESVKLGIRYQKSFVDLVDLFRPPSVYVKHVCYVEFTEFNKTRPIWFNMVRDPIERAISWYYYVRAPWYFVERKEAFPDLPLPSSEWLRKDFETCVRKNDRECQYIEGEERHDFAQLTEFFCGQDRECSGFNNKYALQKAKENVEKVYSVVGVLEEMNMTLTVLENFIPRFFNGASDIYWNHVHKFTGVNKNIYKPTVSEEVKQIVRKNFTREIEFYEFCRQRLHMQYGSLNLDSKSS